MAGLDDDLTNEDNMFIPARPLYAVRLRVYFTKRLAILGGSLPGLALCSNYGASNNSVGFDRLAYYISVNLLRV